MRVCAWVCLSPVSCAGSDGPAQPLPSSAHLGEDIEQILLPKAHR